MVNLATISGILVWLQRRPGRYFRNQRAGVVVTALWHRTPRAINNSGNVTSGRRHLVTAGVANVQNRHDRLDGGPRRRNFWRQRGIAGASISGLGDAGIFVIGGLATISNSSLQPPERLWWRPRRHRSRHKSTGTISRSNCRRRPQQRTLNNYGSVSRDHCRNADLELDDNINNYAGGSISGVATFALGTIVNAGNLGATLLHRPARLHHNVATGSITG